MGPSLHASVILDPHLVSFRRRMAEDMVQLCIDQSRGWSLLTSRKPGIDGFIKVMVPLFADMQRKAAAEKRWDSLEFKPRHLSGADPFGARSEEWINAFYDIYHM